MSTEDEKDMYMPIDDNPTQTKATATYWAALSVTLVSLIQSLVFNALSATKTGGIFQYGPGEISDKFSTRATPAGWTFAIWSIIFLGLSASAIFAYVTAAKQFKATYRVYSYTNLGSLTLSYALMTGWLFAFDREDLVTAAILLPLICFTAAFPTYRMLRSLGDFMWALPTVWYILFLLMINFHAIYATWTAGASTLNIGIMIQYDGGATPEFVQYFIVSIVLIIIILFAALFILGEVRRSHHLPLTYLFTIPIVFIWTSAGILSGNETPTGVYAILVTNICVASLTSAGQIVSAVIRYRKNGDQNQPAVQEA